MNLSVYHLNIAASGIRRESFMLSRLSFRLKTKAVYEFVFFSHPGLKPVRFSGGTV